jgi:hypothetical protein
MIQDLTGNRVPGTEIQWSLSSASFDARLNWRIIRFWWHCVSNLSVKFHAHMNQLLGKRTLNGRFAVCRPASVWHCNHQQSETCCVDSHLTYSKYDMGSLAEDFSPWRSAAGERGSSTSATDGVMRQLCHPPPQDIGLAASLRNVYHLMNCV